MEDQSHYGRTIPCVVGSIDGGLLMNKPIKVTDIEEHEDGSATIQVECDPETFAAIFDVGFVTLIKAGLDTNYTERLEK
tara:strand:- start:672 stop:908 length:237 start_codon:yes stop_codon:yes gene_type:complete